MTHQARRSVIEGAYLADLLAQPATLHAVRVGLAEHPFDAALLSDWKAGRYTRVVLTGMGGSLHALYPLHRRLSGRGIASHWVETAELLHGFEALRGPDTLLITASQSGESAEIVTLTQRAAEFGHVIGITNEVHSTLGRSASSTVQMHAGAESSVSCKTYMAAFSALHVLSSVLSNDDTATATALRQVARAESAVREYLAEWRDHVDELLPLIDGVTSVFVTGRGESLATAGVGGLILKESTRRHAEGMSAAAFRHGPMEMAGDNVLLLVCEGDESTAALNRRLVLDVARGGGRAVLLSESEEATRVFRLPAVPAPVRPLVELLPVQMLSLAIAARDGIEAGRFQRISKVTDVA